MSPSPISNDFFICQRKKNDGVEFIIGGSLIFYLFNFLFYSCFLFVGFCNFTLSSMSKSWLPLVVLKMKPTSFVH